MANYVKNMNHEVGVIAHSCGVKEARQFRRKHAHIVLENGNSRSLQELYPQAEVQQIKVLDEQHERQA